MRRAWRNEVPAMIGREEISCAEESLFLDQLDEVADVSADGYADLKEVLSRVSSHGLLGDRAETILNRLEEEGVIEEPIVGKLRRA